MANNMSVDVEIRPLGGQLDPRALDEVTIRVDGKVVFHLEMMSDGDAWAGIYDGGGDELHALGLEATRDRRLVVKSNRY